MTLDPTSGNSSKTFAPPLLRPSFNAIFSSGVTVIRYTFPFTPDPTSFPPKLLARNAGAPGMGLILLTPFPDGMGRFFIFLVPFGTVCDTIPPFLFAENA
ncbi:hypothetical protein ATCV1_z710R [Acanthocystis turfacea chlorella virus 1]|uniref:Uncharacterized protein z710R n=1 Tax=Chlorovirus heliozoae TaxID=322019 RepID=A7K9X0_9PHYC|nr:hypothetical protein ATCV1_z710R [Acanthocystis turfacea chlorella virus 1]ABT16844.1 hypothetical protein ATCV1_z710R [Acanthocystis turfacea chlorella virus 1]